MKKQLLLFLLFSIAYVAAAQPFHNRAEVIVIGTIHTGNKEFGHRKLYLQLQALQPDIVLWEQSSDFKRVPGLRIASFLRIWKPGIEQLALQKFSNRNSALKILPFDTLIADRVRYVKRIGSMTSQVVNSLAVTEMDDQERETLGRYTQQFNQYYDVIFSKTLEDLNRKEIVDHSRQLFQMEKDSIVHLVKKYCRDSALKNLYVGEQDFWELRNEYMIRRISAIARANPGKKIIVLTGLNHKYFLVDGLKLQDGVNHVEFPGEY